MKKTGIMLLILMLVLVTALAGCGGTSDEPETPAATTPTTPAAPTTPATPAADPLEFSGVEDITIDELTDFDPLEGVTAKAGTVDHTASIEVTGEVNTFRAGEYTLTYRAEGETVTRTVTVAPIEATLPTGTFNYKFATADTRHTFMAAAEEYLLQNNIGGIPLFANASFSLFSSRMQLLSEESLPVMGFGLAFSTMSADDSRVLMQDGEPGNVGEYTLRQALASNPETWNHWEYQGATTADILGEALGRLYRFEFNDDLSGFVVVPSMAADNPVPIDGEELPSGTVISRKWQIPIAQGLQWKFNPNTDTSMITKNHIDANDFVDTYRIALENGWFRAISGGGDFLTSSQSVVGAADFRDGLAEWEDVGIKLIDDYTMEFHFNDDQSEWDVMYWLSSFVMTPINIELYEALGDQYGLNERAMAYHGIYYVDYFESDVVVRYVKNDLYHDADKYFYTHRTFAIIEDAEMRFQEFLAGRLDTTALPPAHFDEYRNHPGLKRVPGATTFRMMHNSFGTLERQLDRFPDTTREPSPILANQDFLRAIYFAIDRQRLAEEVLRTSQTQMYHFTDAYLVEPLSGIPYRDTPQGRSVGLDLSPSTFGYNLDAARALFEVALDQLVADGVYSPGDHIVLEFNFFSGSDAQELMAAYLRDAFQDAFGRNEKHNITLELNTEPKDFPGIYFDYMMTGNFDLSIGGIAGGTLDAAGFLRQYASDNRGGFTLIWGIDTSHAEVPVVYENDEGIWVKELWSFDAITSVLSGEIEVIDGREAKVFDVDDEDEE